MKSRLINIMLIAAMSVSAICQAAAENPNVGNQFGSGGQSTVPSQGRPRRLLTSPNPLEANSNNVVTGTVGGLRYFHGVVPYGSQYYNSASLDDTGTASVNTFLRQSTDPILSDRNPSQTRVYYEPRRTVSSFYVQNGKTTALSESIAGAQPHRNPIALPNLPKATAVIQEDMERPLASNNLELDQILARQFQLKETAQQNAKESILENKSKFENFFKIALKPEEAETPTLEKPITEESLENILNKPTTTETEQPQTTPEKENTEQQALQEPDLTLPEQAPIRQNFLEQPEEQPAEQPVEKPETEPGATPETGTSEQQQQQPAGAEGISMDAMNERSDLHAQALRILGEHPNLESLSQARFSNYMQAAEEFMRDGKFYKAADTYGLAAVWQPDDSRSYAGQAFALFAAGEYMSSAYYLNQAIVKEPAFVKQKYNLAELIGNRDVFENRLIEMATWQQRSGSGELAFLMAYVLYQDGKTPRAAGSIQRAEEKMPDNQAVSLLKNAITSDNGNTP